MKRLNRTFIAAALLVFLAGSLAPALAAQSIWQRMAQGFPNSLVVYEYVYEYEGPGLTVSAQIPQLIGAPDLAWQEAFNQGLRDNLADYASWLKDIAAEALELDSEYRPQPYAGFVDFEVKLNQGGLLSIAVVNYVYTGGAHGMTYYDYLNIDLTCGQPISFSQIFDTEAEIERAAAVIAEQIKQERDLFFDDTFTSDQFREDQGFYLQENHAVICFTLYELAPYSSGIPEFAISAP
ncbi:MAG: DUF3298 and DUF4163 domain-containing protein [Firmicutes bacterium]|nr:DUF3298 and DUF4163 domain-containing protein [Bacillota bacterium]